MGQKTIGLGDHQYQLAVYIGNRPMVPEYKMLDSVAPLVWGDISHIVDATGNHWRKIFNIYAKLMFQLDAGSETTWQAYRDNVLLQNGCGHALIFSSFEYPSKSDDTIAIISGKSYAQELGVLDSATPVGEGFYIDASRKTIVTPYFDYRQLSNRKLDMLISIIKNDL